MATAPTAPQLFTQKSERKDGWRNDDVFSTDDDRSQLLIGESRVFMRLAKLVRKAIAMTDD
jgi:hypothetical protein